MWKLFVLLSALLFFTAAPFLYGQDSESPEDSNAPEASQKASPEEGESRALRSFYDTIAGNARNHLGFSLNASAGYISNVSAVSSENNDATQQSLSLNAFANLGRRKSHLHISYSTGYNRYNHGNMNGAGHHGDVNLTYQATRNVNLRLYDTISSTLNDPFSNSAFALTPSFGMAPSYSNIAAFLPERFTRNQAGGEIGVRLNRNLHFNLFSSYNSYRYGTLTSRDNDAFQVGCSMDKKINNWLSLTSTYSAYLNNIDERFRDNQIHNLEIGNFHFKLARNVAITASGGFQAAKSQGSYHAGGVFRSGISRSTRGNTIYANYERTMTSATGYSRILMSDIASLGFGQRIASQTSSRLSGSCTRSSDFSNSGHFYGCSLQAQLSYAIASNLFASADYTYQYQQNAITVLTGIPHFDRHLTFVSLQYAWPSIHLRSE
jgi:hypothetical protein